MNKLGKTFYNPKRLSIIFILIVLQACVPLELTTTGNPGDLPLSNQAMAIRKAVCSRFADASLENVFSLPDNVLYEETPSPFCGSQPMTFSQCEQEMNLTAGLGGFFGIPSDIEEVNFPLYIYIIHAEGVTLNANITQAQRCIEDILNTPCEGEPGFENNPGPEPEPEWREIVETLIDSDHCFSVYSDNF